MVNDFYHLQNLSSVTNPSCESKKTRMHKGALAAVRESRRRWPIPKHVFVLRDGSHAKVGKAAKEVAQYGSELDEESCQSVIILSAVNL